MKTLRCTASALKIRESPGGVDTGRRLIHGQVVASLGRSWDDAWALVAAPAGNGWAGLAYLEEVRAAPPALQWPARPHGLDQIRATFGEPGSPDCSAGVVSLPAPLDLSWTPEVEDQPTFRCHRLIKPVVESVLNEIHRRGKWAALENFGGCYAVREQRGGGKISTHAWGIGMDFDTLDNPLGLAPEMDATVVAIFEDHGFVWGGRWSRPDGMHFQYASGY